MDYTFILSDDARIGEMKKHLDRIDRVSWQLVDGNIQLQVPDDFDRSAENALLKAVAAGVDPDGELSDGEIQGLEVQVVCGALQNNLLNIYLPEVLTSLRCCCGTCIVELDAVDHQLSMIRVTGPTSAAQSIDEICSRIMTTCGVGVTASTQG